MRLREISTARSTMCRWGARSSNCPSVCLNAHLSCRVQVLPALNVDELSCRPDFMSGYCTQSLSKCPTRGSWRTCRLDYTDGKPRPRIPESPPSIIRSMSDTGDQHWASRSRSAMIWRFLLCSDGRVLSTYNTTPYHSNLASAPSTQPMKNFVL